MHNIASIPYDFYLIYNEYSQSVPNVYSQQLLQKYQFDQVAVYAQKCT